MENAATLATAYRRLIECGQPTYTDEKGRKWHWEKYRNGYCLANRHRIFIGWRHTKQQKDITACPGWMATARAMKAQGKPNSQIMAALGIDYRKLRMALDQVPDKAVWATIEIRNGKYAGQVGRIIYAETDEVTVAVKDGEKLVWISIAQLATTAV